MTQTIHEIRTSYGDEVARLMTSIFDLASNVPAFEDAVAPSVRERMPQNEYNLIRASEQAKWAEQERERIRIRVIELEEEMLAAVEARAAEVEALLTPKEASAEALLKASQATPQELIDTIDLALDTGNEDAALLAFRVARQRDLEEVVSHALTIREDWEEPCAELQEAANQPQIEPEVRFDMVAPEAPSKHDLINQLALARSSVLPGGGGGRSY
jgi:hypothetical protein